LRDSISWQRESAAIHRRIPGGSYGSGLSGKLLELHGVLGQMDQAGTEIAASSLNSNAVQGIDEREKAIVLARKVQRCVGGGGGKTSRSFCHLARSYAL
jgi:hypothetical protein